jgi:hypothetical protein
MQAVTRVNAEQASKRKDAGADAPVERGRLTSLGKSSDMGTQRSRRGIGDGMCVYGDQCNTGSPGGGGA